jgi:hypothetical protein
MTDSTDGLSEEGIAVLTVASTAISVGIRCRPCGRLHLPARLWPLAIRSRPGRGAEIEMRCVRCNTVGSLLLDGDDSTHRALLAMWRDQAGSRAAGDDDTKAWA